MGSTGKVGSRGRWVSGKVVAPDVGTVPYGKPWLLLL